MYHIPVLLNESIDMLNIKPDGVYVDCTFGGGGHSVEILKRLGKNGRLYSFDKDIDALKNAIPDSRFKFVRGNFRYISNFLKYYGEEQVDGILADIGVSSHHLDEPERGFSYRFDAPLDMRMNQHASLTAQNVINNYSEEMLSEMFHNYGELRNHKQIASLIVKNREKRPIQTTEQLLEILTPICRKNRENKDFSPIFQAIRIEVNGELDDLKSMLEQSIELLASKGRIVVISYHSLEDRIVKNFFKTGTFDNEVKKDFYGNKISPFKSVSKLIMSSPDEQKQNKRSRSAKMRVAEKI